MDENGGWKKVLGVVRKEDWLIGDIKEDDGFKREEGLLSIDVNLRSEKINDSGLKEREIEIEERKKNEEFGERIGDERINELRGFEIEEGKKKEIEERIERRKRYGIGGKILGKGIGKIIMKDKELGWNEDMELINEGEERWRIKGMIEIGILKKDERGIEEKIKKKGIEM